MKDYGGVFRDVMLGHGFAAEGPCFLGYFHADVRHGGFAKHEVVRHVVFVAQNQLDPGSGTHREPLQIVPHLSAQGLNFDFVIDLAESRGGAGFRQWILFRRQG